MKNTILLLILGGIFFTGVIFFAYKQAQKNQIGFSSDTTKLHVVASFYPMYFFAAEIGGDKAEVMNMTPASAEPHDYEPTTQDVAQINQSALLVINGGKLEAWGDKLKEQLQGTNVLVVTAGEGLANRQLDENGQIIQDPHIWQDPLLAKREVANIEKGYEKVAPAEAAYFKSNAQKLDARLDELNTSFKTGLAACQKKDFVTSHAAFGYLAARYGITQIAISGVSPDEEPSLQTLIQIADLVKKQGIKIIFFESLVSPKLSETIAQETGARTMVLDPIEGLTDNDLKAGKNYFTVMQSNLSALRIALQCNK